ncbi:MAG: hypothetical protein Q8R97_05765, partial [Brevundimonas sp.]|nr:hypothetical protein [Brevundimonas sp.]
AQAGLNPIKAIDHAAVRPAVAGLVDSVAWDGKPARRGGLRKRLVRALLETDLGSTQLLQLLPHLESSLSQSTYVLDRPDLATRRILAPLARDPAGRKWLASHQFYLTAWYGGSEEATRQIVRGAIQRAAQNGDRSARALLVLLRSQAAHPTG